MIVPEGTVRPATESLMFSRTLAAAEGCLPSYYRPGLEVLSAAGRDSCDDPSPGSSYLYMRLASALDPVVHLQSRRPSGLTRRVAHPAQVAYRDVGVFMVAAGSVCAGDPYRHAALLRTT